MALSTGRTKSRQEEAIFNITYGDQTQESKRTMDRFERNLSKLARRLNFPGSTKLDWGSMYVAGPHFLSPPRARTKPV